MSSVSGHSGNGVKKTPFGRRLLAALGIGLLATLIGSAAGAIFLALFGAAVEGWNALRAIPPFLFYGIMFGPVLAWPVSLVVLPAGWLFFPQRYRRVALLLVGPLAGAAVIIERLVNEVGLGSSMLNLSMVLAGTAGGLAAGITFVFFTPQFVPTDRQE